MSTILKAVGGALLGPLLTGCAHTANQCTTAPMHGQREIVESARMEDSTDPCWWLSSGGLFWAHDGVGRTIQGRLPAGSEWQARYAKSNARDTDGGHHPQNLLRLISRTRWQDYEQQVQFRILKLNLSESPERDAWSGVLMFQRYLDSQNLYYAGLRVDGTAVIKKKLAGKYFTLAQAPVFALPGQYDRAANPLLLPEGRWVHMCSHVHTRPDGSVWISLLVREADEGAWRTVVEAVDDGSHGAPILAAGYTGLRSDFMDVEFSGYTVRPVDPTPAADGSP